MRYDSEGVPINLSEEDITKKYPLTYKDIVQKSRLRYKDFKQNSNFHSIMKEIKKEDKFAHNRKLDPKSAKS